MLHQQTHIDATIAAVLLPRRVLEVQEPQRPAEEDAESVRQELRLGAVGGVHAVVVEGDAVDDADEEQRPVRAALCHFRVAAVVHRQEDVRRVREVWQRRAQGQGVFGLQEQKGHAWA